MRRGLVLVLITLVGGVARADDAPKSAAAPPAAPAPAAPTAKPAPAMTPEQAADAVVAAVRAKDDSALKVLAAKDAPDPWLVADELIRRGEFDEAAAFAVAAPRKDVDSLPGYVASRRSKSDNFDGRSRLRLSDAARRAGNAEGMLDVLGPPETRPPEDVTGVRLAFDRGLALQALSRFEDSAKALLIAAEAAERIGWLSMASAALHQAGLSAHERSDYAGAYSAWEKRLLLDEARGDESGAADAVSNLGVACYELGDYAKALAMHERARAMEERLGDAAGVATTLGNIGNVQHALGDYAAALATQQRALAAKVALGDEEGAAFTLGNMGVTYEALGDYAKALEADERALAAKQALKDDAGAAMTLGNIGNVYYAMGDYAKALATQERALAAKEALEDREGAAFTLGNIGAIHEALGDYARALATQERTLAAKEALGDKAGAALTIGNLGNVYCGLGDYRKALSMQERALAVKEALGDKAGAAMTLGNIGAVYDALEDYAKALATYERALAAKEALGDKAGAATTRCNIGNTHASLGDFPKALASYERALGAQEAIGDRAGAALTLASLGVTQAALGDSAKAFKFLERAVRAAEKLGTNALLVRALGELARLRLRFGDAGRSIPEVHRAVSLLKTLVGGLGEEQGATARGQYAGLFATGLAASASVGDASEAAFFLESGRAGTMLESLDARDALRHAAIPEELRLAEAAARAREARALVAHTKAQDGGDLAVIRARDEELKAARAGVQEVVERIQRDAKKEAHLWYPVATPIEDIQGFLAPGDALVLYGLAEKDDDAHALVLTKDAARIVPLGKSSEIVTACEALDLGDRDADPAAGVAHLRDLVVKPLGLAKETKRLLVSPEGPLSYVPFAALVPDLVVAYESSGSTYGVLREEKDKQGAQVLALADADYTAKFDPISLDLYAPLAAAGPTRGGRLAPLPGTREEAMAVADVKLFGKDASESGLRAALAKKKDRWHSVHFACHGLVNPDRPTLSSLALTPEGENDGFLTALEVLKMEIPSDLVVLSACETGKGKIVGGEGIVGLTRAFMYAGSPRVICSLWKVDDEATKELMTKFYELWNPKDGKPGLPTGEALKQAQEFVKSQEKRRHPYFWAAWVLWGLPE